MLLVQRGAGVESWAGMNKKMEKESGCAVGNMFNKCLLMRGLLARNSGMENICCRRRVIVHVYRVCYKKRELKIDWYYTMSLQS